LTASGFIGCGEASPDLSEHSKEEPREALATVYGSEPSEGELSKAQIRETRIRGDGALWFPFILFLKWLLSLPAKS
jgi:hypothetical protein